MSTAVAGWTKPLQISQQRADPSGVQDASSTLQAILLPGMSTVTGNVRYISLFAAARHHRMLLGESSNTHVDLREHLRRLEALIAVSSYRHHEQDGLVPTGIVGTEAGRQMSEQQEITLRTGLQQPPYNIYRGTMSALGILDTTRSSDPLHQGATELATAWQQGSGGFLVECVKAGALPETIIRSMVDTDAAAFCLCAVPQGSEEQRRLYEWIICLGRQFPLPTFSEDGIEQPTAYRAVSWRLFLELVAITPTRDLSEDRMMARLLEPDLLSAPFHPSLRSCLFCWRWVAARTFFERGWTRLFNRSLSLAKNHRDGLSSPELRDQMAGQYVHEGADEPLSVLVAEARDHYEDGKWLKERYDSRRPRDLLLSIIAGIISAKEDLARGGAGLLAPLWSGRAIPFELESRRLTNQLASGGLASEYWSELAEQTLVQHVRIALRKMSSGNPDSLHIDFDSGRWRVPNKALNWWPNEAAGSSRLDIALAWSNQLGIVTSQGNGLALTAVGERYREQWDREHLR